jgi:hypothetical protein
MFKMLRVAGFHGSSGKGEGKARGNIAEIEISYVPGTLELEKSPHFIIGG